MPNNFGRVNKKLYISISVISVIFLISAIFFYKAYKDRKTSPFGKIRKKPVKQIEKT